MMNRFVKNGTVSKQKSSRLVLRIYRGSIHLQNPFDKIKFNTAVDTDRKTTYVEFNAQKKIENFCFFRDVWHLLSKTLKLH